MSEHTTQKEIVDLIVKRGGLVIRVNSGNVSIKVKGARKGTSDLIALYKSKFLGIEVKDGNNTPSPEQILFGESVKERGGVFILAYDTEKVKEELDIIDLESEEFELPKWETQDCQVECGTCHARLSE